MKLSVRISAIVCAIAAAGMVSFAPSRASANPIQEFLLNHEKLQLLEPQLKCFPGTNTVCSTSQPQLQISGSGTLNMKITFTNQGGGSCDSADSDVIGNGISVKIGAGICSDYYTKFYYTIPSFTPKTVGGVKIGTYFALNGPGTVTAKATTQATMFCVPAACGTWTLEFQATKVNLPSHNPIVLILTDKDGDSTCFDINDALIGTGF